MSKKKEHKKVVPELRFGEFEEDGNWRLIQLGNETTKIGSGKTPRGGNKNYKTTGRPFVRSQNIGWGVLLLDDIVYIDEELHKTFLGTEIKKDDVLLNITGASIGRSAIVNNAIAGGNVNQHVCIIRTKKEELNHRFLNQFILSNDCQNQIDSYQTGGNREGLNFGQIGSLFIPLPPKIAEQQKIANTLTSLDDLIAAENKKLEALKAHKKGLLQQLFPAKGEKVPNLRFGEFEGDWEEKPLAEIAQNMDSKRKPIASNKRKKGNIPYYGASGVIDYVKDYIFDEDLLLISEDGANLMVRKYPIAFSITGKTWVNNHAHVLKFEKRYTQVLVEKYLNSISLEDFLTGMAQPKLNRAKLDNILIPLPKNPKEQQKIANCLTSLDELISAQSEKIATLKDHKKGLMQQMFPNV